jgi:CRISPR system Cascade subunit CasC
LLKRSKREIDQLAIIANDYWDELSSKEKDFSKEVGDAVKDALGKKSYAADVALFGRMVADNKEVNVDAACQVAHALSTNEVKMEMDFFTAVDDFLGTDEQGSDMMGSVYFNSSCYYRYAQINLDKLVENLGSNDKELILASVKGFLKASIDAKPTGKQNSSAAQNPVCYVRVCVRKSGSPWSLANAFIQPIRTQRDGSSNLEKDSAVKLEQFMHQLISMYGNDGFIFNEASSYLSDKELVGNYKSVDTLANEAVSAVNEMMGG